MKSALLKTTAVPPAGDVGNESPDDGRFECDTPDTFCAAMKIGKTAFYADVGKGLIRIIKRGKKTLVPPGERRAYLQRLAALAEAPMSAA